MEENLKNSEAEYRAIFEGSKSAVAIFNVINDGSNFVFKDLNRSAEFIEQIKREDVIGKKVTDVFPSIKDFGLLKYSRVFGKQANQKNIQLPSIKMKELKVGEKTMFTNFHQGIWWQFTMI